MCKHYQYGQQSANTWRVQPSTTTVLVGCISIITASIYADSYVHYGYIQSIITQGILHKETQAAVAALAELQIKPVKHIIACFVLDLWNVRRKFVIVRVHSNHERTTNRWLTSLTLQFSKSESDSYYNKRHRSDEILNETKSDASLIDHVNLYIDIFQCAWLKELFWKICIGFCNGLADCM